MYFPRPHCTQVSGRYEVATGFGPLVMNGYGICYNNRAHSIVASVSAHNASDETSAIRFREELERSLMDMHDVCVLNQQIKAKL